MGRGVPRNAVIAMSNGIVATTAGIAGVIGKSFISRTEICHRAAASSA
jgi:hypothetical protein